MRSSGRAKIVEVFDALEADFERAFGVVVRCADHPRAVGDARALCSGCAVGCTAVEHPLVDQVAARADATEQGRKRARGTRQTVCASAGGVSIAGAVRERAPIWVRRQSVTVRTIVPPRSGGHRAAQRDGDIEQAMLDGDSWIWSTSCLTSSRSSKPECRPNAPSLARSTAASDRLDELAKLCRRTHRLPLTPTATSPTTPERGVAASTIVQPRPRRHVTDQRGT